MRVAVTGASGFVGGAVLRALRDMGHTVLPFGRRPPSALSSPVAGYQQWDIEEGQRVLAVDAVVHCAARVSQWDSVDRFRRSNVHGTSNVLASVPRGARVVYMSTASVYSHGGTLEPIPESASVDVAAISPYALSKLEGERVALAHQGTIVLRPHIVYGQRDGTLWPRVVAARRGGSLRVPGNGSNRVSVTHVDNLAQAVVCALDAGAQSGVYNVADMEAPTVGELLQTMFERHALPTRIRYVPRPIAMVAAAAAEAFWTGSHRAGEPPLTRFAVLGLADPCVLDISRARSGLRYDPRWSFRDGPL